MHNHREVSWNHDDRYLQGDIGGIEPSVIELYALEDIADLSVYGIEIARDGSAADGQEYALVLYH